MTWTYRQSTGEIYRAGELVGIGYSGHGVGLNNPSLQASHCVGPIPCGLYEMTAIVDSPLTGLASIILQPSPRNEMFGRSGFRIHGDNAAANHSASEGCIVYGHAADRHAIWDYAGVRFLNVTE